LTLKDLIEPIPLDWDRLVAHFLSKDISPTQPICVSQEMEPSVTIFVVSDIKTLVLLRANATHERLRLMHTTPVFAIRIAREQVGKVVKPIHKAISISLNAG
jgi:hypothetical protein